MCRSLLLAVAFLSLPALAQVDVDVDELDDGVDTTLSVPGAQVRVRTREQPPPPRHRGPRPAPAPAPQPPPPAPVGGGNFSVECGPMNGVQPRTIKVVSPEGAAAQVWNEDGSLAGQYSVPFNFRGRSNTFYRFIVAGPDGAALLDKKLEAKQFIGCLVRLRGAVVAPAPAPVAAAMSPAEFAEVLAAVNDAGFSEEKTGVIEAAARRGLFSVEQVGELVDALSFSADKVKAVELTRHRLVDPHNGFKLLSHFSFSADKEKVRKLLP